MKTEPCRRARAVYIEYLEKRIAPATFVVTNLNDSGAGSLRDAVDNANTAPGADTIVFRGSATSGEIRLSSGEIVITDSLNIKGPGAGKLTVDAQTLSRIFNIDDGTSVRQQITISGLSMIDGNSGLGNSGGGIRSVESLTISNSVISGCLAFGNGGAIFIDGPGNFAVRNSKLTVNSSGGTGGAIHASVDGVVQIISSFFARNIAAGDGGAMFFDFEQTATEDILIDRSTVTHNSGARGGGIWADNDRDDDGAIVGRITIRDSVVSKNSATNSSGGGIYISDGNVLIERSRIANNTAVSAGGGLSSAASESVTVLNSEFRNNRITGSIGPGGGGIYVSGNQDVLVQKTSLSGNTAAGSGGGLLSLGTRLILQASTLSGNTASQNGGGIYGLGGTVYLRDSTAKGNRAFSYGGGVATAGSAENTTDLVIAGSLFSSNRASAGGGGVNAAGDGNVEVSNSRFLQNTAGGGGGGLYLRSARGSVSIVSSRILQNTATDAGGGLKIRADVAASITGTLVANNFTADEGGGIYLIGSAGRASVTNSIVRDNVASERGGGIWTGPIVELFNSTVTGNVAPVGAQLYGTFAT